MTINYNHHLLKNVRIAYLSISLCYPQLPFQFLVRAEEPHLRERKLSRFSRTHFLCNLLFHEASRLLSHGTRVFLDRKIPASPFFTAPITRAYSNTIN